MESKIIFREMLGEIRELADSKGGRITTEEVDAFFAHAQLTKEQLQMIYAYLAQEHYKVEGYEAPVTAEQVQEEKPSRLRDYLRAKREGSEETYEEQPAEEVETAPQSEEDEEEERPRALEQYLDEIVAIEELSPEEQLYLFHAAAEGDAVSRGKLAEAYLAAVCDLASEYEGGKMPVDDLIQEGNIGLLMALSEMEKQESLAGYQAELFNKVGAHIREALKEEESEQDGGSGMAEKVNLLNDRIKVLEEDLGYKLSVEELSAYLDMPAEEIKGILELAGDELKRE